MLTSNPQASGLRAAAALLEYAEIADGLSIIVTTEGAIDVQVTEYQTAAITRAVTFSHLSAVLSVDHEIRTVCNGPWRYANGEWDGHPVKVYCPISAAEQVELSALSTKWAPTCSSDEPLLRRQMRTAIELRDALGIRRTIGRG